MNECLENEHNSPIFMNDVLFSEIKQSIRENHISDIDILLKNFCCIVNHEVIIDIRIFKLIALPENYDILYYYLVNRIQSITFNNNNRILVHLNMETFYLTDIDKYSDILLKIARDFQVYFPDKLEKCYVYSAGFIFKGLYSILSGVVSKDTRCRFVLVKD